MIGRHQENSGWGLLGNQWWRSLSLESGLQLQDHKPAALLSTTIVTSCQRKKRPDASSRTRLFSPCSVYHVSPPPLSSEGLLLLTSVRALQQLSRSNKPSISPNQHGDKTTRTRVQRVDYSLNVIYISSFTYVGLIPESPMGFLVHWANVQTLPRMAM